MKILRYTDHYQLVETMDQIVLTDVRTSEVRKLQPEEIIIIDLLSTDGFDDWSMQKFEV